MIVDDEIKIVEICQDYLQAAGFSVVSETDGMKALHRVREEKPDLIVLDLMLPNMDGLDICREIRRENNIPIIMLTARVEESDKLVGLELGADDYITKPFSMEELLLRMQAILRRTEESGKNAATENIFPIGNYLFEYNRQTLTIQGKEQKLTSKEAGLLRLLCLHANDVLDRGTALREVWNDDSYFNARSMDVYIVKLRKYLKEDPRVELINVHGVGFKLVMNK